MIALVDTHVLLWSLLDRSRLSTGATSLLQDRSVRLFVSAASVWEIAIKRAKGKVRLPLELSRLPQVITQELGMEPIRVEFEHAITAGELPPIHGDPFDRLLIAQATLLGVPILTADPQIARYDVETIW